MNVYSLWWRVMNILFSKSCHQILTNHTVQSPAFVTSGNFLSHSCQETLRVEKSSHPKYLKVRQSWKNSELTKKIYVSFWSCSKCCFLHFRWCKLFQIIFYLWSAHKAPSSKLTVTFKQFGVPKTKSGRLPRHFFPYFWNPCIIHSIQKGSQCVTHYNSSFNSQFQIWQIVPH